DKPVKVYNFEVEDWHTYFVSEIGVLVHNKCTADPKVVGDPVSRVYDPSKPMSPSNYPNPDPDFTAPPVRYEPKTIEEVERMRKGKDPTTKATDGDRNIEVHHKGQKSVENNGGILDDLEDYTHRRDENHTRHVEPSELTPAQRAKEIRE
ncbi:polymorphic toxin-type HINT domain-containing protein, partial [Clostridium tunisiense]|uniref:polymorphic toxin-type HINT domain-containing protein n=1 Tax=Clostridium tunisiense TaxID=219748 RepID=UPI001FA8075E